MDLALFGRYFLDFALLYPSAFLCLAIPMGKAAHPQAHRLHRCRMHHPAVHRLRRALRRVRAEQQFSPARHRAGFLLAAALAGNAGSDRKPDRVSVFHLCRDDGGVFPAVDAAQRPDRDLQPTDGLPCLQALLRLGLAAVLTVLFWFTAVQWSRWLLREYSGEAFWQSAWPLPALYAVFLVYCMPLNPAVVLVGRLKIISVLAVSISLFGIFLLLYEMYRVAREFARNARLDRENQLLAMESRRYMELQTYLDNTRRLRHDFRQHLHVIAGLTETGQLEELKSYLHQYESELSEHRPSLCANAAVDALAGYYDHAAGQQSVPVEWKLALPRQLPMPEADLCTILGNLLENALHASQKLPPEQRRVQVMAQMLSPAMLGLVVENRYDGMLKKQQGILHSTKHEGTGIGLVSAETVVHKYNGNLHLETEEQIFRVNVLLNL